jgi:heat shock protein 4
VYDTRGKPDDKYAPYVKAEEKQKLLTVLSEAEDWLYTGEGEDAIKSAYVSRLDALKVLGDPITFRCKEVDERKKSTAQLRETINTYMSQATSTDEKYAHIDEKDKQSVVEKVATIQKWLEDQTVRQSERSMDVDSVLTSAEIEKKRDELIYYAIPILTKPKSKPPVIPSAPASGTHTPKSDTSKNETPAGSGEAPPPKEGHGGLSEMDVD